MTIENTHFVGCVCGTGCQWTQWVRWSKAVSVHKFIEESKFQKERAQDMTNQHNKTFCDIVSDFGEKVKSCWSIVLFLCSFFMLQRLPLGGTDHQICFIILWSFALKTPRHFSLFQILSFFSCCNCLAPFIRRISGETCVICIPGLDTNTECATFRCLFWEPHTEAVL